MALGQLLSGNIIYAPDLQDEFNAASPIKVAQRGVVTVTITAATSGTATVNFSPAFATVPVISATIVSGAGALIKSNLLVTAVSTTSMTVRIDLAASATATPTVHWIAII